MLQIHDHEHYQKVVKFAADNGCLHNLEDRLGYLASYGGTPTFTTCDLYPDFAPYSFAFVIKRNGEKWFNGGLIYSGPGIPANGSAPSFTVDIDQPAGHNWGIHT